MEKSEKSLEAAPSVYTLSEFHSTVELTKKYQDDEKPYNPFENRNIDKPNSTMGSLAHLLKSSLGTGVLAMPMAFKNAGLVFGAIGTLVVGFLCTYCVHMLVKTSHDICRKAKIPCLGFAETAEKIFEYGPPSFRRYSKIARNFVDYSLVFTYLGASCVYFVFIATSFRRAVIEIFDVDWDVRIFIAFFLIPLLLMGQFRNLKYLVPFSALANLFIIITFAITLYYMFNEPLNFDKPNFTSFEKLPMFFSTVIFAMEGIGVVMPVENTMKKPQHFLGCPGVLNSAMIIVVSLYAIMGFFGYVKFGDEVHGSITLNLPDGPLSYTVQILIGLAILFTFGLQFYVPMDILWNKISDYIPPSRHNESQILMRSGIILILAVISAAVPSLDPFIGLVGSIFFSTLGILIPAFFETVFLYPEFGIFKWKLIKNVLLFIFALVALISGSFVSIRDIVEMYS